MYAPVFACKSGSGAAGVPVVEGATYSWSAEGASITTGAGTPRVGLAFGEPGNVKLTCVITTAECSRIASATVAVREPIAIAQLAVPQVADADHPVTLTWSFAGTAAPASQMLTGDAFEEPVELPAAARSYTFTPKRTGARNVELRASYFTRMSTEGSKGKRRAAGRSTATATDCAIVSMTRRVEVKGCDSSEPAIIVPGSVVDAGVTFEARVDLGEDERAQWSVENGLLVTSDEGQGRATIRAGESGDVKVTATIVRGACTRAGTASLRIVPAARQCNVSPVASLTMTARDCYGVTMKAAFTGTPPFRGVWSDGTVIYTNSTSVEHRFEGSGSYTINDFRDESCIGVVSGAQHIDALLPTAKLETIGGNCTTGKLVVTLTGTPPFNWRWIKYGLPSVEEWVTTSSHEYVRELGPGDDGEWFVTNLSDASCFGPNSNHVRIDEPPVVEVRPGPFCMLDEFTPPQVFVDFEYGRAPYSVTWSDGVVTTSNSSSFSRTVPKPTVPLQAYTIASATAFKMNGQSACLAEIANATGTVSYRPKPRIQTNTFDPLICPGETGTATLSTLPAAEATIVWTVPGGEILSGQGTGSITFRGTSVADSQVRAEAVYPDGSCTTFDQVNVRFHGVPEVTDLKVMPATIRKGQGAQISFTSSRNINSKALKTDHAGRQQNIHVLDCPNDHCSANYVDTVGPGTVVIELQYSGDCVTGGYKSAYTTLTIVE